MSVYEALFRHVLFPAYESGLRRRKTLRYLAEFEHNQWLDPEQIRDLQWAKLQRLLRHCWQNVPYYRECWKKIGVTPDDIRSAQDYAALPVLTKDDIRANADRLIARGFRDELLFKSTGGSTGEPLRLGYTRESYEKRTACMFRGYGWTGARPGQRTLYLWGVNFDQPRLQAAKDRLHHALFNRRMVSAYRMSSSNLGQYVDAINAYRPETIVSYVAPAVALAEWILAGKRSIHSPARLLTAAEALHEHERELLQRAFGCPVYNTYGCREFMLIAGECEARDGLHVSADQLFVELSPTAGADASGEVVVTDLSNYGMPFVRYVNGDIATRGSDAVCACGRGLPRLERIEGRKLDMIRTASGQTLPGEFFPHMFMDIPGVRRFQVVQSQIDAIHLSIVADDHFTQAEHDLIRRRMADTIGTGTAVEIQLTDHIPLTSSGKLRVTVSQLP